MVAILTLTSKNQLTLPVEMVRLLSLTKGSKLIAELRDNTVALEKVENSWDDLQGSLKETNLTKGKSVLEIIEMAKEVEAKRLAKKYGL